MAFLFVLQIFEDTLADLAFLDVDPYTDRLVFAVACSAHIIRKIVRDMDWLSDPIEYAHSILSRCGRERTVAVNALALVEWRKSFDRYTLPSECNVRMLQQSCSDHYEHEKLIFFTFTFSVTTHK